MASRFFQLERFVEGLVGWGLMDVMLPFLLIFAVMFAILQKTKVFGDGRKNINMIVALVIGLSVVIPHVIGSYPANMDVVDIINNALPQVSLVVIAVVMLLILIGIFGGDAHLFGMAAPTWIAVISIIAIVFIFGGSAGWWGGYGSVENFFTADAIAIIVMLLIFGIIISFITSADSKEDVATLRRFGIDFGKIFKGGKD